MLAQEIIRRKRDGLALDGDQINHFVRGLVDNSWSDAQAAAMAMACFLQGMNQTEKVALTRAMMRSGEVLQWADAHLPGPVLDKHSTGGVGDKVSLPLAPIVAACGGFVPMISGRGLGHTGGTLDKFDSIPGYQTAPSLDRLRTALHGAGCAIIGQTAELAPADRRLYAIRDVTATVESIPLITASILSKKLAAGLQGLVMDVKTGNGAFAAELPMAQELARSLVQVARGAGLPTRAWITDMSQVLGHSCGHTVEMLESVALLQGRAADPRLLEVTRMLSAELLLIGGLADTQEQALARVDGVLANGRALERFARMVAELGGPTDFVERAADHLPQAPVVRPLLATRSGWLSGLATRDVGLLLIEMGGGRRQSTDKIDHRVGFSQVCSLGQHVQAGDVLAMVHAADEASAEMACARLASLMSWQDSAVLPQPVMVSYCDGEA